MLIPDTMNFIEWVLFETTIELEEKDLIGKFIEDDLVGDKKRPL